MAELPVRLRRARLAPGAAPVDVLVADGRVGRIDPMGGPAGEVDSVDLDGRIALPGLWDHHVHFDQWTMVRRRIDLAAASSAAHAAAVVAAALPEWTEEVVEGYGYRAALWPDPPHAELLDAVAGDRVVVLASADLHSAWLSSAALRRYGLADHPTGWVLEREAMLVFEALREVPEMVMDRWAAEAATAAAARGVVGIVELEAPWQLPAWQRRMAAGLDCLRVACGVWPSRLDDVLAAGLRSGDIVDGPAGLLQMGPVKVITDGSLNTRTAYCHDPYPGLGDDRYGRLLVPPDELRRLLERAHSGGLDAAVHAIGDHANSLALQAFAATGARGSIEHAQLLSAADVPRFAELGLTASVQPEHALDDRDVADHHWAGRTARAFMLRALLDAGARLALGSDAPVAPLDPWVAIAAATTRTRDDRPPWHPEQEISVAQALAASCRGGAGSADQATVTVGAAADLVVLDADPYTADAATLRAMPVAATMLGGRWTLAPATIE